MLKDGQTAAQVARDLGVVDSVLHNWFRQAKIDRGMGPATKRSVRDAARKPSRRAIFDKTNPYR